jgi:hypothetical protein
MLDIGLHIEVAVDYFADKTEQPRTAPGFVLIQLTIPYYHHLSNKNIDEITINNLIGCHWIHEKIKSEYSYCS